MHSFSAPFKGFSWAQALPAAVWLFFCMFPLLTVFGSPASAGSKAIAVTVIACFCAFYTFTFGAHHYFPRGLKNSTRVTAYGSVFLLFFLVIWVVAGSAVLGFVAYFIAFLAFVVKNEFPRSALSLSIGTVAGATALGFFTSDGLGDRLLVVALAIFSPVIIYSFSISSERHDERLSLSHQLKLAEEREAIATDLHDLLGNTLTIIHLKSEVASKMMEKDPERVTQEISEIKALARQSLSEVRAAVTRIQRPDLAGEISASKRALETANINFYLSGSLKMAGKNSSLFSWVLREGITNVIRHSQASNCWVDLEDGKIQIQDDGAGWSQRGVEGDKEGGLNGLRKRVALGGGTLVIESAKGKGTTLLVTMTGDHGWIRKPQEKSGESREITGEDVTTHD